MGMLLNFVWSFRRRRKGSFIVARQNFAPHKL
jgi:hypothetical protein